MIDVEKVIARARGEVGVVEQTRINDHPRIEMYLNRLSAPPAPGLARLDRGLSWCAAFVLWCYWVSGYALRGNYWLQRRVATLASDAHMFGAVVAKGDPIEPGDLLCWLGAGAHESAGPSGHVAMVVEVSAEGVQTIGGNERIDATHEGVRERFIRMADVRARVSAIVRPSMMLKGE
jgi:hypothetical protein